jgi:hypothetical protein
MAIGSFRACVERSIPAAARVLLRGVMPDSDR